MSEELNGYRARLDEIDRSLTALLAERMELSRKIGAYKKERGLAVYDPAREQVILDRVSHGTDDPQLGQAIAGVYRAILDESKELQR